MVKLLSLLKFSKAPYTLQWSVKRLGFEELVQQYIYILY